MKLTNQTFLSSKLYQNFWTFCEADFHIYSLHYNMPGKTNNLQ